MNMSAGNVKMKGFSTHCLPLKLLIILFCLPVSLTLPQLQCSGAPLKNKNTTRSL